MKQYTLLIALLLTTTTALARDPAVIRAFRKVNPCPSTGKTAGACPGWVVDHGIPLCAGGADKTYNLYWQNKQDSYLKDSDERSLCRRLKTIASDKTSND